MTKLYPVYKDVARFLALKASEEPEFSHRELAELLKETPKTNGYRLAVMQLRKELLEEYGEELISITGVGYKIASEEEKIKVASGRLQKRVSGCLNRQRTVLRSVRFEDLDTKNKGLWERHVLRNALISGVLEKARLNRLKAGMKIEVTGDIPRLIE